MCRNELWTISQSTGTMSRDRTQRNGKATDCEGH